MRPKPGVAAYISKFNARSILLQTGLALSYASGDTLFVDISLSNFGASDLPTETTISWAVFVDGKQLQSKAERVHSVPQGGLGVVTTINYTLPDVGTSDMVPFGRTDGAKTVTVVAQLSGNSFAVDVPPNSWNATLFPRWRLVTSPTVSDGGRPIQVTSADLLPHCGFSDCQLASFDPVPTTSAASAVYLTPKLTAGLIENVKSGSVVVLTPFIACTKTILVFARSFRMTEILILT